MGEKSLLGRKEPMTEAVGIAWQIACVQREIGLRDA